jgi:peptidyl-prolyl cis-trans isomerase D
MLISLRSKGASWVVKGLFVVLIGSFALWGAGHLPQQGSAPVAATVGGTSITADELRRAVDFDVKALQRRAGTQLIRSCCASSASSTGRRRPDRAGADRGLR